MSLFSKAIDDRDESVNAAHLVAFALVAASIGWVTYLVIKNHVLPDLTGIAYLLGGSGAMNICSKAEGIISKFKKKSDVDSPSQP